MIAIGALGGLIFLIWLTRYFSRVSVPHRPWFRFVVVAVALKAFVLYFLLDAVHSNVTTVLLWVMYSPILLPGLYVRLLLVPLGFYRAAHALMVSTCPLGSSGDFRTNAVLWGALALARVPARRADIAWLRSRLPQSSRGTIQRDAAEGILHALERDNASARHLFRKVDKSDASLLALTSLHARTIARDWLVMDALRHGRYDAAVDIGRRGLHSLRWSWVAARMAERMMQKPFAPYNWQLRLFWLCAPRRRANLPLLRAALAVRRQKEAQVRQAVPVMQNLSQALTALIEFELRHGQSKDLPDRRQFQPVVRALENELSSPGWMSALQEKLAGVPNVPPHAADTISQGFRKQISDKLVPILERWPHLAATSDSITLVRDAIGVIDERLQREIETSCKDYRARTRQKKILPGADEEQVWNRLSDVATRLFKLAPDRRPTVFQEMFMALNNFAVHLHTDAHQTGLAHDIYTWLHRNAGANTDARTLLAKNMDATKRI